MLRLSFIHIYIYIQCRNISGINRGSSCHRALAQKYETIMINPRVVIVSVVVEKINYRKKKALKFEV